MNPRHTQRLSAHLSLWIASLGAIIFISVLSVNYFLSRDLFQDYVSQLAKATAAATTKEIDSTFQTVINSADSLAKVVTTDQVNESLIHQNIKAFLSSNSHVFGMAVALEPHSLIASLGEFSPYYFKQDDKLIYADLATKDYQYQQWPWYKKIKDSQTAFWSEPYLDEGGGNILMTTYSSPIWNPNDNSFAGVATADIQLSWLNDITKKIKIHETGFGYIVSRDDIILTHPNKEIIMKNLIEEIGGKVPAESLQNYIGSKNQSSSLYFYSPCIKGEGFCWVAIESLGNTGWKIIIVIPENELIKEINILTFKIITIAVLGLFLLIFIIQKISTRITAPLTQLTSATKEIGEGNLDTALPESKRPDEIGALSNDFNTMRLSLKKHIEEVTLATAKQQKLDSEIQIAQDIQLSMLPGAGNVSIKESDHQLFAYLKAAKLVGGDLYYYQKTDNMIDFILGDVSDKGVPAALFMAKTITLYTRALKDKLSPGPSLTMMNSLLSENNDACMFVTALCGTLNLDTGDVTMSNAGHMNPFIKTNNRTFEQTADGATALGLMEGIEYPEVSFKLDKEASLIMYTDGISEAHDIDSNQYTDEKLLDFIGELNINSADEIGKAIIDSVDDFSKGTEQFDDITLLIIQRH